MKKKLSLLMAVLMASSVILSACGGSSSSTGGGEAVPPSQDIQGGATAQAPGSESGLTVADLPSWLNPTGAEPAA